MIYLRSYSRQRLFGGKNKCPHDLPTMANGKILHKCGGVQLAIITMASLLVNKPMDFWSKVYNSIGFGHEDKKDIENTRKILLFSYYDLPSHLRTCLLYMSIYPEDHFIKKNTLIWKWVTEGFVHEETGAGLYEIGERYFTELVNRSMILPVETPYQGIIFGCRVHDMVLDMICLLSREENFVTILSSNEQYTSSHSNARRLAVGQRVQSLDSTHMPQVRSFVAMCISDQLPLLSCFKVLRVLDLEGVMSRRGPIYLGYLGKLVHLRYLGLQNMHVCVLPEEIGDLKLLQVLDLSGNGDLTELPCSIGLLSQLKCLNIEGTDIKVLDWIGSLTSLEELCLTRVEDKEFSSLFVNDLSKLTELRKLRISRVLCLDSASSIRACAESLAKLQKIQVIDIFRMDLAISVSGNSWLEGYVPPPQLRVLRMSCRKSGLLAKISSSLLLNLTHLSIHVESSDLKIFGLLPELVTLRLYMVDVRHHGAMGSAGAFPKLRFFKTDATLGQFAEGDMPRLKWLQFSVTVWSKYENLHFDFGSLGNLPELQKVTTRVCCGLDVDTDKVDEAVKHAIEILPKRLVLRFAHEDMFPDEEKEIEVLPNPKRGFPSEEDEVWDFSTGRRDVWIPYAR
ncbi:unnamed protein product [Triticum turgidum subsp. durum]|uniref:NB-ARC domain-containing protein n=1 Tax=Triticum turgidum subsp. durum TaxID=4567 RepID=A0A9R0W5Y0_TRITD|nr:unnamed protein product [Triticum turgidum subsp. durum]